MMSKNLISQQPSLLLSIKSFVFYFLISERACRCYNNAYYAEIGGISTAEMNKLELNFLFTLEFNLHVTTEVFAKYCSQLDMEGAAAEESWVSPMIKALGTKLRRLNRDGKT